MQAVLLWLHTWWPLILIAAGLVVVAEWLAQRYRSNAANATASASLPRLGFGVVSLLIVLVLLGVGSRFILQVAPLEQWKFLDHRGLAQIFGTEHESRLAAVAIR